MQIRTNLSIGSLIKGRGKRLDFLQFSIENVDFNSYFIFQSEVLHKHSPTGMSSLYPPDGSPVLHVQILSSPW